MRRWVRAAALLSCAATIGILVAAQRPAVGDAHSGAGRAAVCQTTAYVPSGAEDRVSTIDVPTRTKDPNGADVTTIDVATRFAPDQDVPVGAAPSDVAFTPCPTPPPPPPPALAPAPTVEATPRFTG